VSGGVLVIIPTYNESESLPGVISRVRESVPDADVLVADDNSPDGTGTLADELAASDPHIHVLHRPGKEGLGRAYLAGFGWGLERGYDVLVEMDADGSHRPEELPRLLAQIPHSDVVLGSRWVPGGSVVNWPLSRRVLSQGGSLYTRLALGIPTRDATGGYRAYRASALAELDLASVDSNGYCFQIDLLWRALQRGLVVREVPITFVEREAGTSKMSGRIVREALVNVARWGAGYRLRQISGRP
jgi:dolichol-phosphate mannosyltransferase